MSLRRTAYDAGVILGALRVPYDTASVIKSITTQFIVGEFGVIVNVLNPGDYSVVSERVAKTFKGYRNVFMTPADNLNEKRYEILWTLMQSGYMKWLRLTYNTQFPTIIETDNLGGRIIEERLSRWDNMPMYGYLIADNLEAQKIGFRQMLSRDPSFFDYMP